MLTLQEVHDQCPVEAWNNNLEGVGNEYGLELPICIHPVPEDHTVGYNPADREGW